MIQNLLLSTMLVVWVLALIFGGGAYLVLHYYIHVKEWKSTSSMKSRQKKGHTETGVGETTPGD